ncbi:interferon regulatory factor 3-like isoform X2 [Pristis pectinata]|uniref:interferon regulatory factor 3-like isoform X2 n=1 Tax=Pristis pectinata TaxID=685728 RepID=UPI00223CD368|nr:interferon regulatory factor 3-like isoform X2 [Pristis pectinata]
MSSQKPLLCPWLINQIDSGQYPGLCWVNEEKKQFRIPWKHCLRQNISADDIKIFEAWATASGRYKPGTDVPNPPIWKRNFRSALARKKHFRRVLDNRSDPLDPHLVYEIQSTDQEASACSDEEEEDDSSATGVDHVSMPAPPNTGTLESSLSDMRIFDQTPGHSNQWALEDGNLAMNIPNYFPIQANSNPALGATAGGAWAMQPPVEDPYVTIPSTTEFKAQMKEYFPGGTLVTEFEVSIYYRGRKIWKEFVKNTNGFRLSYNTESAFPYLQDVWLPNTASVPLSDQQQIKYTTQLLERVDQGLTLEVQNNLISAQRYGRCKVFWSIGQDPTSTEPQEISNRNFTVLYGLAEFNKELYDFVNSTGGSPQYSIWLCFGELWPDRNGKSWNKKMIMVRVTPVTFKLLHELALGIGASSLKSDEVNLQFSDHLSTTSFLSVLEEYMDLS